MRTTNRVTARMKRVIPFLVVVALLLAPLTSLAAPYSQSSNAPLAKKAIFFAADGMRPDLMEKYAGEGVMPTYAELMATGVKGVNGLVQAFPPNTGVGWYTLATGNDPSEHGSTKDEAYEAIYQFSEGVPRRVNTLCDRLFLHASLEEIHEITRATVDAVSRDIVEEQGIGPGAEISAGPAVHDPWARRWTGGTEQGVGVPPTRASDPSTSALGAERVARVEQSVEALTEAFRQELAELRRAILAASRGGGSDGA